MVVPMKKAVMICLRQNREALLNAVQQCGELMPIEAEGAEAPDSGLAEAKRRQTGELLKKIKPYEVKKGLFAERPQVEFSRFMKRDDGAAELQARLDEALTTVAGLQAEDTAALARIHQLEPWLGLDIPAEQLAPTDYTVTITGCLPINLPEETISALSSGDTMLRRFGDTPEGTATLLICCRGGEDELLSKLKEIGFTESPLPVKAGMAAEEYDRLVVRRKAIAAELTANRQTLEELSRQSDELALLYDQYSAESDRETAPVGETAETVYLQGWIRSDRRDKLQKALDSVTSEYDLAFYDPLPEEIPPTATKNNWFVTQFETITDMFSRPCYGGSDPNPVMAPWYWIIFGMMMGDVGYGLMMLVFIFLFIKLKKPRGEMAKLVNVLWLSSFTTLIFGVLFGSYFGETWHPLLFGPLENPIGMLALSLIVGVLHIFTGMIVRMAEDIRNGRVWDAIFDQLSWMILILGAGLMFLEPLRMVGIVLAIVGALVVLLTAGRKKKGIGKVTGGLLGLYNITSFMSDILSYARIMALGLATGVIGMVMNTLAGLVMGIPVLQIGGVSILGVVFALAVYAVGHIFNLAMSLLSAYVHDSRLQYIEFYNKFYDGGGEAFKPLAIRTRHVDITNHIEQ